MRRDERHVLRRMLDAPVPGKRLRGRQATRRKDSCKRYMGSVGLKEEDAMARTKWKNDMHDHSGNPRRWEKPEEKKLIILREPFATRPLQGRLEGGYIT